MTSTQLWKEQQRAAKARKIRERRARIRKFALGSGLIVFTVAVAMALAR